jgi:ribosome biogenesis protein UTP30
MEPGELAQNIEAVVTGMVEKFIPQGWRNLKAIHVKGPNTMALPVWATEELWLEEGDVLEAEEAREAKRRASQKQTVRKGREGEVRRKKKGKLLEGGSNGDMSQEMILRREKLREQKREAREVGEEEEKKGKKRKGEAEGAGAGGVGEEATKVKKAKKRKAVESSGVEA